MIKLMIKFSKITTFGIVIAVAVIVGGGAFYGGMKYAESKSPRGALPGSEGSLTLTGEIISQSDDSLTIKLSDGSTKIVVFNDHTLTTKTVRAALNELNEGGQVFVSGNENPDGSYTAQTIQLSLPQGK